MPAASMSDAIHDVSGSTTNSSDSEVCPSSEDADSEYLELGEGHILLEREEKCSAQKRARQRNRRMFETQQQSIYRGARRVLYCTLLVPLMFLMLYLPLYSNVERRYTPHHDWGYNISRNISDYVLPNQNTTILEPYNVCGEKIFLLIIVCSSLQNFVSRQTIRETWGNTTEFSYDMFPALHAHLSTLYLPASENRIKFYKDYIRKKPSYRRKLASSKTALKFSVPVRVLFLVGRSKDEAMMGNETLMRLRSESTQFNDIIQENFYDTYNNLTLKTVLALKWFTRHCTGKVAFFMKSDDDTFVNVPNLIHFLLGGTVPLYADTLEVHDTYTVDVLSESNRFKKTKNYLSGYLFCTSRPIGNITSKWYMPYYMFPYEIYPSYLSGAGYVMSSDVATLLYTKSLNTTFVYLEDVYLTGICAERVKLPRTHNPLFSYTHVKSLCSLKGMITQHEWKDNSLSEVYAFVANVSNRCPAPDRHFRRLHLRKSAACG